MRHVPLQKDIVMRRPSRNPSAWHIRWSGTCERHKRAMVGPLCACVCAYSCLPDDSRYFDSCPSVPERSTEE